jgi:predicted O-methyltransferase YrrM
LSRLAKARRRARVRGLQRRIARGVEPAGSFVPHRRAGGGDSASVALRATFEAARPAFAALARRLESHGDAFARFGGPPPAPRFAQDWFTGLDAAALYTLVRDARPARIVEIGSGHSTRISARAVADGGLASEILAVDPAPRAALAALPVRWHRRPVQELDPGVVDGLASGDVLFVDSSHVLVAGSDVAFLFTELIPRLRPGVLLHVHDVFLPEPYPAAWAWRGYNEQQAVAGLLAGGFALVFASRWVRRRAPDLLGPVARALPVPAGAYETSLWLRRT